MSVNEFTASSNFDDLNPKLQDTALLDELSSKFEEVIKTAKDSNGVSLAELIEGFNLKISIKITDNNTSEVISDKFVKTEIARSKTFFPIQTRIIELRREILEDCWCRRPGGQVVKCPCPEQ